MRYILDSEGYIYDISFGAEIECDLGTCIEYTGEIPTGYTSLEEWAIGEDGKLNAWKIQDGNLVFDSNKYEELQALWEVEEEENTVATHEWTREQIGKTSSVVTDEFSNNVNGSNLIVIEDSGAYDIPKIVASSSSTATGNLKVVVSNKNILANKAVTTTIGGITFTINNDKSITLNGTSTEAIEFTLDGTPASNEMLFLIKENTDYIKSGLTDNVSLNLYNYDGTDTTLISSGGNGIINLTSESIITRSSLSIASGVTFDEVTIYPQIEVDDTATSYVEHLENSVIVKLSKNKATIKNKLNSYNPITIIMIDRDMYLSVDYFKYKSLENKFAQIEVNEDNIIQQVQNTNTTVSALGETINNIQSTILEQTNEAFTMWFEQTGVQNTLDTIQNALDDNTTDNNTLKEYIHFEGAEIILGRSDSQTKLVIKNDRISFMTGDTESAYISENTLYITDSTILNKMQIGHWETKEDDYGNLNTKWIGGSE